MGTIVAEFLVLALLLGSIPFYFLPSIIGIVRKKTNFGAIVLLNLFLGWTLVGWVVALVWAVSVERVDAPAATLARAPAALCAHCGKYNLPAARFCSTCGQAIA